MLRFLTNELGMVGRLMVLGNWDNFCMKKGCLGEWENTIAMTCALSTALQCMSWHLQRKYIILLHRGKLKQVKPSKIESGNTCITKWSD